MSPSSIACCELIGVFKAQAALEDEVMEDVRDSGPDSTRSRVTAADEDEDDVDDDVEDQQDGEEVSPGTTKDNPEFIPSDHGSVSDGDEERSEIDEDAYVPSPKKIKSEFIVAKVSFSFRDQHQPANGYGARRAKIRTWRSKDQHTTI